MAKKIKIDILTVVDNLHFAWEGLQKHERKNTAGSDDVTINDFSNECSGKILQLAEELKRGTFHFSPLKRATIEKDREILIYTVRERIVLGAILKTISPRLEKYNSGHDFSRKFEVLPDGVTPDFSGIAQVAKIIQEHFQKGYVWVLEADIEKFFDNVPKEKIYDQINSSLRSKRIVKLIREIIYFKLAPASKKDLKPYDPKKGLAQGSPLSPLLASIYLYDFDMFIYKKFPNVKLIRYVDDFIILCKDRETADLMYEVSLRKLGKMGLHMYELGQKSSTGKEKTKITLAKGYRSESFDFLGLTFNYLDIDITKEKKLEIEKKIRQIIHSGRESLLQKARRIESRLRGYLEQYNWVHYSRTPASLARIINFSETELREYYAECYKRITHQDPFKGFSTETKNALFTFLGVNFEVLRNILKNSATKRSVKK